MTNTPTRFFSIEPPVSIKKLKKNFFIRYIYIYIMTTSVQEDMIKTIKSMATAHDLSRKPEDCLSEVSIDGIFRQCRNSYLFKCHPSSICPYCKAFDIKYPDATIEQIYRFKYGVEIISTCGCFVKYRYALTSNCSFCKGDGGCIIYSHHNKQYNTSHYSVDFSLLRKKK